MTAASDEDRLRKIARDERHLAGWTRGFATHGSFSGPTEDVTELFEALEPLAREALRRRPQDRRSPADSRAYRFDALIALARGARVETSTKPVGRASTSASQAPRPPSRRRRRRLRDPRRRPGPVAHAREVLSHGLLELVITDGVDVQTVGHHHPARPQGAQDRDRRTRRRRCKIRDCDHTRATERHHTARLRRAPHHQLPGPRRRLPRPPRPHHPPGYDVIDNGDGTWSLRQPPHQADAA